jgi:hypothetical protein
VRSAAMPSRMPIAIKYFTLESQIAGWKEQSTSFQKRRRRQRQRRQHQHHQ